MRADLLQPHAAINDPAVSDHPPRVAKSLPSDRRILQRLVIDEGPTDVLATSSTGVIAVVDVETTGFDSDRDSIIELAVRRVRHDAEGRITQIGHPFSWLQDPQRNLSNEIVSLTGLTNEQLAGQSIDRSAACQILDGAAVIVAHHAKFDRPFVEKLLPDIAAKPWACSCVEIDWPTRGFANGRKLGCLCCQAGWFFDAHRGSADVDAVIAMLGHADGSGRTALAELLETAGTPGWRVQAFKAPFERKDILKAHGYRWNANLGCWWREIAGDQRAEEETWLAEQVYDTSAAGHPQWTPIDWTVRHAA